MPSLRDSRKYGFFIAHYAQFCVCCHCAPDHSRPVRRPRFEHPSFRNYYFVERSMMTRSPLQHEFSRRTLLRSGLALGAGISLGSLVGCATPTGAPGPRTVSLALNRSLVSLDNKLNQFDAALTVQRGERQALTEIDRDLRPPLVLADP